MKYFYSGASLSGDPVLQQSIEQAAERLCQKLQNLDLKHLGVSEYMQGYLGGYQKNLRGILQINTYLLAWSLNCSTKPRRDFVFVDYGGGPGVLTFLAREAGVGTVIYNDIYNVSCRDAALIGEAIGCPADAYICGEIAELQDFFERRSLKVDAIASYDVIEHIYETEGYFRKLKLLPHQNLRVVFASSANIHNPLIRRSRMKGQLLVENQDRQAEWGHKERDTLESYSKIRQRMIATYDPQLTGQEIDALTRKMRGLAQGDIERYVREYRTTGKISYQPDHPTNTCDPFTGNWHERLMDTGWIKRIFSSESFEIEVKPGYFAFASQPIKQWIKILLNGCITLAGSYSLFLSPYYLLYANLVNGHSC